MEIPILFAFGNLYSRSIHPFNVFESQILKKKNLGEQLNFDLNLVKKALN
jgi:hypothetical protein